MLPLDQNASPTLMFYDPTRVGESPLDNFFLNQSEYNSTATLFYNAVAGSFGIAALRSIHDVWMQLTGIFRDTVWCFPLSLLRSKFLQEKIIAWIQKAAAWP